MTQLPPEEDMREKKSMIYTFPAFLYKFVLAILIFDFFLPIIGLGGYLVLMFKNELKVEYIWYPIILLGTVSGLLHLFVTEKHEELIDEHKRNKSKLITEKEKGIKWLQASFLFLAIHVVSYLVAIAVDSNVSSKEIRYYKEFHFKFYVTKTISESLIDNFFPDENSPFYLMDNDQQDGLLVYGHNEIQKYGRSLKKDGHYIPIEYALNEGYVDLTKKLIQKGWPLEKKSKDLDNKKEKRNKKVKKYFYPSFKIMTLAAYYGDSELLSLLESRDMVFDKKLYYKNSEGFIHMAGKNCNLSAINHLLKKGHDPDIRSKDGKTAIHFAIDDLCPEAVGTFLSSGAKLDSVDKDGNSYLEYLNKNRKRNQRNKKAFKNIKALLEQ